MSEEKTITLKKSDLWKYSTFLLIAIVIIGGFFVFTGKPSAGNATGGSTGDVSAILGNPNLYPSLGPDNAKTTVIEFADFQCPFCGMAAGLAPWVSQYSTGQYSSLVGASKNVEDLANQGKIKFIYVSMSFLGQGSVYASEAGFCANEQGKFWEMHDAIFTNQVPPQQEGTQFTKAQLETMAAGISGMDTEKFNSCLESDKYSSSVQQASQGANSAGVTGTPTFMVNGKQVSASWPSIQAAISA